jgi:hypothetical protein
MWMLLVEAALKLIFLNSSIVDSYTRYVDEAMDDYDEILEKTTNINQLREVLKLDKNFYMPVPLAVDTYEKYLTLNRRDASVLRDYAVYIEELIPDWKDYAEQLIKEAEDIEEE